jgi:hypothetical protein
MKEGVSLKAIPAFMNNVSLQPLTQELVTIMSNPQLEDEDARVQCVAAAEKFDAGQPGLVKKLTGADPEKIVTQLIKIRMGTKSLSSAKNGLLTSILFNKVLKAPPSSGRPGSSLHN